ncbi:hypothetical protein [Tychonema sp. LEGE 06208]|uniref:hypothetical protein n=1 Tax=Tychonema sp. LEGE 06208 TaxID=1828663 RepID=UPI001880418F|nr:hypothetical protein [Tychonema sp. LEGE 06208]MBE9165269.1 hypothetical protein [Tychonema sp. LEGE 06208]
MGGAKRRDWAERSGGIGRSEAEGLARAGHWAERSGGIGRSEAEGLGGAKRRDWAYLTFLRTAI